MNYVNELNRYIYLRTVWNHIHTITNIKANLFILSATIISFLEASKTIEFKYPLSGILNTCALSLLVFSYYAEAQSRKKTDYINAIRENPTRIPYPSIV
jgi:hypothetical protein